MRKLTSAQIESLLGRCGVARQEGRLLEQCDAGLQLLKAVEHQRAEIIVAAIRHWLDYSGQNDLGVESKEDVEAMSEILRTLITPKTLLSEGDWTNITTAASRVNRDNRWQERFPFKAFVASIEAAFGDQPGQPPGALLTAAQRIRDALAPSELSESELREFEEIHRRIVGSTYAERSWEEASADFERHEQLSRKSTMRAAEATLLDRLDRLLSGGTAKFDMGDAVGAAIARDATVGGLASAKGWPELLLHAQMLSSNKPSAKWLATAAKHAEEVGAQTLQTCVTKWFAEVGKRAPAVRAADDPHGFGTLLRNATIDLLRGLCWTCAAANDATLTRPLGRLAEACFKKVYGVGPRCPRVGNAAVAALAALPPDAAAAELAALKTRVKHPSSKATVEKALASMSARSGLSADELSDRGVPDFGLDQQQRLQRQIGGCTVEVSIDSPKSVAISWRRSDGKSQKTAPADVRQSHGDDLEQLRRLVHDIERALAAQRRRLELLMRNPRHWQLNEWRKIVLDHPLLSVLARRLIWTFISGKSQQSGMWLDGQILGADMKVLKLTDDVRVALWHPITSPTMEIVDWRNLLERNQVVQPFKQAYREIYLVTDAERQTDSYSNRYAGHFLRQHQFAALCRDRGWSYQLQGNFDSHNTPELDLSPWELRAEFWVEAVAIEDEVAPTGIFLHVSTDQVRFCRHGNRELMPIRDVPPLVFSEVMRDIDLFVGVASVGNDPNWHDGGPEGRYRDYWQSYSFGDLSQTAQTRREVLQRLVPRLRIASLCAVSDRFLVVQGRKRRYKIHLGSGNILMEPNDQYLCIVPDRRANSQTDKLYLPFEGDETLAVIISKAFLLAEDDKITDLTIARQIEAQ